MSLRQILRKPFVKTPYATRVDLCGKHVIVTGASPGSLGLETARVFARWGALVIVTTRHDTASVVTSLQHDLDREGIEAKVDGHDLDLSEAQSVDRFCQWYQHRYGERLDILVNNAGVHLDLMSRWKEPLLTPDGHETQWRINYLGTAHLTHQLLPLLRKTGDSEGEARIVNVVSQLHSKARNDALFDPNTSYNSWKFYARSKLALVHFSNELDRRFSGQNSLHSYSLHPGGASGTYTGVAARGFESSPVMGLLRKLGAPLERLFMSTAEEGAQTQVHCATAADIPGGQYYVDCAVSEASAEAEDRDAALRLWQQTQNWLNTLPNPLQNTEQQSG